MHKPVFLGKVDKVHIRLSFTHYQFYAEMNIRMRMQTTKAYEEMEGN